MQSVNCALCDFNQTKKFLAGKDLIYSLPGKFQLVQCKNCGLIYINPQPDLKEINLLYPPEYTAHQKLPKEKKIGQKIKKYLGFQKATFKLVQNKGKVLDIGCGSGQFLKSLQNLGWECYGVETSLLASQRARELGLNVSTGDLLATCYPTNFFDLVVLNHTLEHLPHPNRILEEIHRILKPKGLLQIYLPNIQGLAAQIFRRYWFNLDLPRHLYHYTPDTLKQMLQKHRFRIFKIKYVSSTSGILGSLQNWLSERKGWHKNFRKNKTLCLAVKPLVKSLDLLKLGDSFYIYALK